MLTENARQNHDSETTGAAAPKLSPPLITCEGIQHKLHVTSLLKQKILIRLTFTRKIAKCDDYKYSVWAISGKERDT